MLSEDTLHRLEKKQEELALLFLDQVGVEDWKDLSTSTRRGDVFWYKRNAGQTMTLIVKIQTLLNMHMQGGALPPAPPDNELHDERLVEQAEKDAVAMIERVRHGTTPAAKKKKK